MEDPNERPGRPRKQRPPVAQDGGEHPALGFGIAADHHRVHQRVGALQHNHVGIGLDDASGADEDELEARCLIAFSVAIADHLIAADHGNRSRAEVRELIRRRLFAK